VPEMTAPTRHRARQSSVERVVTSGLQEVVTVEYIVRANQVVANCQAFPAPACKPGSSF
jgi:hypothetical protein